MSDIQNTTPLGPPGMGDDAPDMDELRRIAFGESGALPSAYPVFKLKFLDGQPSKVSVTEKVTIWLNEAGHVIVEWLDALVPPRVNKLGMATRASHDPDAGARRVIVQSKGSHQPTIELVMKDGPPRALTVRVGEWPLYARDVRVRVRAGEWVREGATNDEGEVAFTHLPEVGVDAVQVELMLAKN